MAESKLWDGLPAKLLGVGVTAVGAAMIGAHTDLIRDLPTISPRVAGLDLELQALRTRMDACEVWQVRHEEFARENSRELHAGIARSGAEIEKLRERIDRALERGVVR